MATLYEKYRAEINAWNWDAIIANAENNPVESNDYMGDGETYGSEYIGSVLSLSPSGKYYTPWANSNVDECPMCHGTSKVKNGRGDQALYEKMKDEENQLRQDMMRQYKQFDEWPKEIHVILDRILKDIKVVIPEIQCPRCGGLGSYEAYQDQEFWQALEDVANKHGGWIESGEGDPLDTFFCVSIDQPEDDDSDDEDDDGQPTMGEMDVTGIEPGMDGAFE